MFIIIFQTVLFFWRISIDPSVFSNEAGQLVGVLQEVSCSEGSWSKAL